MPARAPSPARRQDVPGSGAAALASASRGACIPLPSPTELAAPPCAPSARAGGLSRRTGAGGAIRGIPARAPAPPALLPAPPRGSGGAAGARRPRERGWR